MNSKEYQAHLYVYEDGAMRVIQYLDGDPGVGVERIPDGEVSEALAHIWMWMLGARGIELTPGEVFDVAVAFCDLAKIEERYTND
jgi:hypothetical protein